jgi:uncharacterized caspase-like protein
VALVVGNASYDADAALKNPANDASDVADALRGVGWNVTLVTNADRRALNRAIAAFRDALAAREGANALFYYAGHGLQVEGENYLIPVRTAFESEDDVKTEAIPVRAVTEAIERAKASVSVVILDACRDNPFARGLTRSFGGNRGLNVLQSAGGVKGSIVMFSTSPGDVALDGTGRNGIFTAALLKHIGSDLKIEELFKKVNGEVRDATSGAQKPWINASLSADFYFVSDELRAARAAAAARAAEEAKKAEIARASESVRATEAAKTEAALREAEAARLAAAEALAAKARAEEAAAAARQSAASAGSVDPKTPATLWIRKAAGQTGGVVVSFVGKGDQNGNERLYKDADQYPVQIGPGAYRVRARIAEDPEYTYESEYSILPGGSLVLELPALSYSPAFLRSKEISDLKAERFALGASLRKAVSVRKGLRTLGRVLLGSGLATLAVSAYGLTDGLIALNEYNDAATPSDAIDARERAIRDSQLMTWAAGFAGGQLLLSLPLLFTDANVAAKTEALRAVNQRLAELEGGRR